MVPRPQRHGIRHHWGDGLGLSLVRDVVEAHGGEVSLASVDGSGTTVRLLLPAAPATVPEGNAAPTPAV